MKEFGLDKDTASIQSWLILDFALKFMLFFLPQIIRVITAASLVKDVDYKPKNASLKIDSTPTKNNIKSAAIFLASPVKITPPSAAAAVSPKKKSLPSKPTPSREYDKSSSTLKEKTNRITAMQSPTPTPRNWKPNYHAALMLPEHATLEQIKTRYKKLALKWHPDRNADPDATAQFQFIEEAYKKLLTTPPIEKKTTTPTASQGSSKKTINPMQKNIDEYERRLSREERWEFTQKDIRKYYRDNHYNDLLHACQDNSLFPILAPLKIWWVIFTEQAKTVLLDYHKKKLNGYYKDTIDSLQQRLQEGIITYQQIHRLWPYFDEFIGRGLFINPILNPLAEGLYIDLRWNPERLSIGKIESIIQQLETESDIKKPTFLLKAAPTPAASVTPTTPAPH